MVVSNWLPEGSDVITFEKEQSGGAPVRVPAQQMHGAFGGTWTPNVIWYLSGGPRRFGELRHDIPRISAKVLSARLRELETQGVITRRVVPTSPPSVEYALTKLGQELIPAINAIVEVGLKLKKRRKEQ